MELPRRLSREERGQDDARRDSGDRGRHNTAYWLQREQCIFPGRQFDSLRPADAVEGRCELLRDPWVVVVRSRVCHS